MSELIVQTLYAIFCTLGLAIGTQTVIADHFSDVTLFKRKPFSCIYCLTFWWSIVSVLLLMPDVTLLHGAICVIVVHIGAFIASQKLI